MNYKIFEKSFVNAWCQMFPLGNFSLVKILKLIRQNNNLAHCFHKTRPQEFASGYFFVFGSRRLKKNGSIIEKNIYILMNTCI